MHAKQKFSHRAHTPAVQSARTALRGSDETKLLIHPEETADFLATPPHSELRVSSLECFKGSRQGLHEQGDMRPCSPCIQHHLHTASTEVACRTPISLTLNLLFIKY